MLVSLTYFHTKINPRWIKDLKVMHEVMKITEENTDDHFYNFGWKEASLNLFCFKPEMIKI